MYHYFLDTGSSLITAYLSLIYEGFYPKKTIEYSHLATEDSIH